MKLVDLIDEIKESSDAAASIQKELGTDIFESIELCMKDSMSLESEVKLFDSDSISDRINFQLDGVNYVNLCPFDMFLEFVEESKELPQFPTSLSIAERFIDYIENDA